jgi:phage terminase small subunit
MAGAPEGNINARKGLTLKQKRFCKEYVIDFNAAQAAIRAGFSKKTAKSIASRLLTNVNVQNEIDKLKDKTAEKLEISHEMITAEWANIAFSDTTDLYRDWMTLQDFETMKKEEPNLMRCIKSISTRIKKVNALENIEQIKLEFYSKETALENLGKHIGYYEVDNKQKGDVTIVRRILV